MNELPKVSVVTITYGHQDYIVDTIKGVLMQDYKGPIEFIIANDNSPDNTDEVINSYLKTAAIPPNIDIKNTKHTTNKGMMPNFIWALQQATGDYIAMCEGDDYWIDPLKLQKQVDFLEDNDEYGLVHTNYFEYYEKNNKIEKHKSCNFSRADENRYYLKTGDIRTLTVLFRSKFIAEIKVLFDQEFMKNAVIGDRPIFLLISSTSKIKFFDEIMGTYRISATNSASHFSDLFKYYNFLYQTSVLNQNLYNYFKIEACNNSKQILFLKTVLLLKDSTLKGTYKFITNGLLFSNFREFYSILKFKLFFFKK